MSLSKSLCLRVFVSASVCVRLCPCAFVLLQRKIGGLVVSKVTAASSYFSFLELGGGFSDHRRPTFHKFILSRKRNRHFCVIPCHITHCPLVFTNAEKQTEKRKGSKERSSGFLFQQPLAREKGCA